MFFTVYNSLLTKGWNRSQSRKQKKQNRTKQGWNDQKKNKTEMCDPAEGTPSKRRYEQYKK